MQQFWKNIIVQVILTGYFSTYGIEYYLETYVKMD